MTRKDLLAARANDVVEVALSKGVCLSEAECTIVQKVVLAELLRVEREMLSRIENQLDNADNMGDLRNWLYGQELEGGT